MHACMHTKTCGHGPASHCKGCLGEAAETVIFIIFCSFTTLPHAPCLQGQGVDESGKESLGPLGFSRFYNNQGIFSWAPCTVREYDRERDMYLITWHSTGKPKWVKRLNLFFENESRIGFRFRLRQARRRKEEVRRVQWVCWVAIRGWFI